MNTSEGIATGTNVTMHDTGATAMVVALQSSVENEAITEADAADRDGSLERAICAS